MNRNEKIELLKGIANGTTSINDAVELQDFTNVELWLENDNSTFTKAGTGEVLTKEQYEARNKGILTITFS